MPLIRRISQLIALTGLLVGGGCTTVKNSTTMHSSSVQETGFLNDYERLESAGFGHDSRWTHPEFEKSAYDALHVPMVGLWISDENNEDLSSEDANRLAQLFHERATTKLAEHGWQIVEAPGERTLTLWLALTELEAANPYGGFVTTAAPYLSTAVSAVALTADLHVFVGRASTELQIVDSTNKTIFVEAIDRRVGAQSVLNIGSTWGDVEDAIDIWTDRIAEGLSKIPADEK